MNKLFKLVKNNLLGFIIGTLISGGIVYATTQIAASNVTYNNTTVDGALNDLYTKASTYNSISLTLYHTTKSTYDNETGKIVFPENKFTHFTVTNLTPGNSASCGISVWANTQGRTIEITPNTEYQIRSDTDGNYITSVALNSTSATPNTASTCYAIVTMYNKN